MSFESVCHGYTPESFIIVASALPFVFFGCNQVLWQWRTSRGSKVKPIINPGRTMSFVIPCRVLALIAAIWSLYYLSSGDRHKFDLLAVAAFLVHNCGAMYYVQKYAQGLGFHSWWGYIKSGKSKHPNTILFLAVVVAALSQLPLFEYLRYGFYVSMQPETRGLIDTSIVVMSLLIGIIERLTTGNKLFWYY